MRRWLVVGGCLLLAAACVTADTSAPTVPSTTSTAVPVSTPASGTTTAAPTPTSTLPVVSITLPFPTEPRYVVGGPEGVFRVEAGGADLVLPLPDVMWAADDGMGGLLYYPVPGVIKHLAAGAATAVTIATDATPNYLTMVDGYPCLAISQIQQGECRDADDQHTVLIDLVDFEPHIMVPCVPLESAGIHPRSVGGTLALSVDGGGWPDEAPLWSRLVFRDVHLPPSITGLTGWDQAAWDLYAGLELDVAGNPWPEPCPWCAFDARLSPDGTRLALVEFVPAPSDLDTADWSEFDALDVVEQWRRWEEVRRTADVQVSVVEPATGRTVFSALWPGPGGLLDFDGRYLVYQFQGEGNHSQFPDNTHLIDTDTGTEIPIEWGAADPGSQGFISLSLPG